MFALSPAVSPEAGRTWETLISKEDGGGVSKDFIDTRWGKSLKTLLTGKIKNS